MTLLEITNRTSKILDHSIPGGSCLSEITRELVIKLKPGFEPTDEDLKGVEHVFLSPDEIQITISKYPGLHYRKIDYENKPFFKFPGPVSILEYKEGDYLYFDPTTKKTCSKLSKESTDPYFLNRYYCALIFNKLNSRDIFHYDNTTDRQLVLYYAEFGVLIVHYENIYPINSENIDFKANFETLVEGLKRKEFVNCLKLHICERLTVSPEPYQFSTIIANLGEILSDANKTYELYMSSFSFTKLREDFRTEKEKYFSSIREIINQILTKVITIPISIAVAAKSIYDLRENSNLGWLVLISYLVYSLFTTYLLKSNYQEVEEIEVSLQEDLDKVINASPSAALEIITEKTKVTKKITQARFCIILVQVILASVAMCAVYFTYLIFAPNAQNIPIVTYTIGTVHLLVIIWTLSKELKRLTS